MTLGILVPVDFANRPEVLALSDAAYRAHSEAMGWCMANLTEGRIPARIAPMVLHCRNPKVAIKELVSAALWTVDGEDYLLDWEGQYTAEDVMKQRAKWREDKERRKRHDIGDHSKCTYCEVTKLHKKDQHHKCSPRYCDALVSAEVGPLSTSESNVESNVDSIASNSHSYLNPNSHSDSDSPDGVRGESENLRSLEVGTAPAHGSAARGRTAGEEETRLCVECTKRHVIAGMVQDELTSMWRCVECVPEPSPKRRTGILPIPEPGTYKSKREIEREQEQARKAAEDAERARVAEAFKESAS
jgi:hypothetical protein